MNRMKLAPAMVLAIVVLHFAVALATQQGQATFSDTAPPPNEEQKKEAQRLLGVATSAQNAMSTLGEALRATVLVEKSLASQKAATTGNQALTPAITKWQATITQMQAAPPTGDQVTSFFTTFRNEALAVAKSIAESAGVTAMDRQSATSAVTSAKDALISRFDLAVLDHGLANHQLRFHPYASVVKQPFIECSSVNNYSRDFRCLPKGSSGTVSDAQWIAVSSVNLSEFCTTEVVAPYSRNDLNKFTMYVRRSTSLDSSKIKPRC